MSFNLGEYLASTKLVSEGEAPAIFDKNEDELLIPGEDWNTVANRYRRNVELSEFEEEAVEDKLGRLIGLATFFSGPETAAGRLTMPHTVEGVASEFANAVKPPLEDPFKLIEAATETYLDLDRAMSGYMTVDRETGEPV